MTTSRCLAILRGPFGRHFLLVRRVPRRRRRRRLWRGSRLNEERNEDVESRCSNLVK